MLSLLSQLQQAVQQQQWDNATQYLQQLRSQHRQDLAQASDTVLKEITTLALQVFSQSDFQARWEIAKLFPDLGTTAIAPLLEILQDEEADNEERWFIARLLGQFQTDRVFNALVAVLETSQDEELNTIVINTLGSFEAKAIPTLTALLQQPRFSVLATTALAQMRHPETLAPLRDQTQNKDAIARAAAIEALGSFNDVAIVPLLRQATQDIAPAVRKEAAIALGLWGAKAPELNLTADLGSLLYDFNAEVCQQAAIALGRIGSDEAAELVFRALVSPATPIPLQLEFARSLFWMETPQSLEYLLQALDAVALGTRIEIVKLLGRIKSPSLQPQAAQGLLTFFQQQTHVEDDLAQALAQAWGYLGDRAAIPVLEQLERSPSKTVQLHAIAALKHF
ncbi:MAG: HEAT repeat domain-containing protein [Spirulinaceae cyanobacterium]